MLKRVVGCGHHELVPPPAHTLIEDDFGQQFWPAYVWDEATGTLKYSQQCSGHLGRTYWNPGIWNPAAVGTPFGPDGSRHRQRTMVSWISATWVHEMVHASQSRANQPGCNVGPAWLGEGIADAVSWYLAAKRFPELDWLYELALSRRRWDRSLDLRQIRGQADHESESYTTASLYRYLAEATETTGTSGLKILEPLVTARFSEPDHREAVRLIDRTVEEHTGRRFYQVFPEFLTEYASYGGSRYTRTRVQGTQSVYSIGPHDWQADVLGRCTSLVLSPIGDQLTAEARIDVNVLAGACVNITWAGFEQPVGLQIEARATDPDSLHLGEAWRQHQSGAEYFCWEVVKELDQRARKKAADKCMLSRELRRVGTDEAAHWTSDFDVGIGGGATFVLANIAEQPLKTVPQVVQLRVSTLKAEADGAAMTPPADKPVDRVKGAPVKQGLSSMRERLHTMTFGEDRRFFDGRSTLAGNRDFAFGDGTDGEGVGAMIRAREYMVVFARPQSGSASAELGSEASAIIKDPASMGGFSGMGLPAIVMSAGSEGL